jgi:hypothetical protein
MAALCDSEQRQTPQFRIVALDAYDGAGSSIWEK